MTNSQHLREQIWDLVYGLLEADESQALIAQIKSDPAAARLYSEVRLQADLVGYAARIEDPSLVLTADAAAEKPAPMRREKTAAAASGQRAPAKSVARRARAGNWLALGAATALAALLAVGQFWPAPSQQQLAANYIVTDIEAPPSIPGGLGNSLAFHTTTLDGEPQSATVNFAIRGREGRELFRQQIQTDRAGRATAEIPGSALEPGVRLEVFNVGAADAVASQKHEEQELALQQSASVESKLGRSAALAADLPVQAEPQMAYILLEEPPAEGDKPVNASVWNFYAFSGKPAPPETAEQIAQNIPGLSLADESGAAVQQGVYKGLLQNQAQSPLARSFSDQNQATSAARSGGVEYGVVPPAEPPAATASPPQQQLPHQQLAEQQPAQQLQKKLDNTPDPQGTLSEQQQLAQQAKQQKLNESDQSADGYARFRSNRIAANPPAQGGAAFDAAPDRSNARTAGNKGFSNEGFTNEDFGNAATSVAPGQPIHVEIPPEYAGKPLVVAANARGVTVANTSVPATGQAPDGRQRGDTQRRVSRFKQGQLAEDLQIELPPEADGPIDVALLDPSSSPPQVVSRNYFYREPARKLQIDVHELKEPFSPGERVQITVAVRDEAGRPAADTRLGVRLWNEDLVQQRVQHSAEQPLLLADALQAGLPGATSSQLAVGQSAAGQSPAAPIPANPAPAEAPADLDATRPDPTRLDAKRLGTKEPAQELERLADAKDKAAAPASGSPTSPSAALGSAPPPPLSDQPLFGQPPAGPPAANDFALPQTGWFDNLATVAGQQPVELATNRPAIQAAYDAVASAAGDQRRQILRALGGAAIFGGMALLILIAILVARRAAGGIRIMLPAVTVSLASLLIGCVWIGCLPYSETDARVTMIEQPRPASATPALIATAESTAEPTAGSQTARKSERPFDRAGDSAPPTIPLAAPSDPAQATGPAVRLQSKSTDSAALAGTNPGSGSQPESAQRALADADRAKAFGGIAGFPIQPAPTLPPASEARTEGAALLGGKGEGQAAARSGQQPAGGAAAATPTPLPASLYFNPNLQTNDQGLATIEFTLPHANSQYRLLIDALGNGRIGSRQDLITIQGPTAK